MNARAAITVSGLILAPAALAAPPNEIEIRLTAPKAAGQITFELREPVPGGFTVITNRTIDITANDTVKTKRMKIAEVLRDDALPPRGRVKPRGGDRLVIEGLFPKANIRFKSKGTGEPKDTLFATKMASATVETEGMFAALDPDGLDTAFTIGVQNDFDLVETTIFASAIADLSAEGVAAALLDAIDDILPSAVSASLVEPTMIMFDFEDGTTDTAGGVTFGAASATGDIGGSVQFIPAPHTAALLTLAGALSARRRRA